MMNQRIGSFIAALRKEQGLTQEQLAEKLGVSNRSVSRWETGKTLPDLSLMQCICQLTGVTLSELLSGSRLDPAAREKDSIFAILALWDREKRDKIKTLNLWFALGLITLLGAILFASVLTGPRLWLLAGLGLLFHGLGFYRNNRDPGLTHREKAILASSAEETAMLHPEELLTFARRQQRVAAAQYAAAFREICKSLGPQERVCFAMVANEYLVNSAPGCWHVGIAVTQDRVFLCGETVAGRVMTRTVMDVYDKAEIRSIRSTDRSILLETARATLTIKGDALGQLAEDLKRAALPQENLQAKLP